MRVNCIKLFTVIIAALFLTTGCWDSYDIDEKDIVTAVVVDKTDKGYAFFVEIASSSRSNDSQSNEQGGSARKSILLKSEGINFTEAREDLDRKADKPIYLGADQCVILTEKMAYSGIEEYMYRMRQVPEYRKTLDVVATPERPEDILNASTENNELVGISIDNTLQTLVDSGHCIHFSLSDLLEVLASPNKCYFMPTIGLRDKELALIGYSVFYGGICKGFIPMEESEGLIIMRAKKPAETFAVPYKDNYITVETHITKRNTDVIYKDGQIAFNLEYKCEATLLYLRKNMAVTDDVTQEVSKETEKMIEKEISDTIKKSQKVFGYDYLNLFNVFRIKYPEAAKNMDWLHKYPNARFSIDVAVDLDTSGKLDYNPRIEENEEEHEEGE